MKLRLVMLVLSAISLALQDGVLATNDKIHITYTVENTLNVAPLFSGTLTMKTTSQAFYNIMQEADDMNSMFRFESTSYGDLGEYITEVNDLAGDSGNQLFWAFMLREKDGDCLLSVGVSTYVPHHGDHVVLSYQYYSIFNDLPACP